MQQPRRNAALRYGLIFGGVAVVLELINAGINAASNTVTVSAGSRFSGLGCLFFLIYLALFFVAGIFAARDTGRTGQGSLAGMIAGLVAGAVFVIVGIIQLTSLTAAQLQSAASQVQSNGGGSISPQELRNFVVGFGIVFLLIFLLILAGLGAGLGALGGLIGKNQYNGPAPMYQQSYYQGMPPTGYPQQPGYPPPPGYPPAQGYPPQQPGYPPAPTSPYPPTEGQQPPQYPGQQ